VVSLDRPAGASATPFVGRDAELGRVTAVYDAAVQERRARLAVVLGSPGLGKSRLLATRIRQVVARRSNRVTLGSRVVPTLLATAGDRLTLSHLRWSDPAGKKWDLENLSIHEVDAEGRTVAVIAFDPDDRRAAAMEMLERAARSDEARSVPAAVFDALRAVNAQDLDRLRTILPDDFVMDDHRRTGLGRLDRETYLTSLAALFEEAPDMTTEILYLIAAEKHGALMLARNFGTLRDGGAFESVYIRFTMYEGELMTRAEMFEPEDLDAARVRLAELGAASSGESAA
jgi:hypothetical protein